VKQLEQNYYKDGFVPAMKALSNLTKSIHSLNTLDQTEKQPLNQAENQQNKEPDE
jgi:hypothetical protein